jgi:signal transduction histidine kinase
MKPFYKIDSLRKRIFLYILIVIVLCGVVSTFSMNVVVKFQMTGLYGTEKEAAVESLSNSLGPLLASHEYQQITQVISSSLIFDNIVFVAVYDSAGTLIQSGTKQGVVAADYKKESHEIKDAGVSIGSFEIGFSQKYINDLVGSTTAILITILVTFLFLAGLGLFVFLGRSVIQPIEAFTRTVKKITPDNLSVRTSIQTEDEIGLLASNFNQMAGELQASYTKLQSARDELEAKVELRTRGERRRADQLRAINDVGRRISAILSLDELLPYVVSSLQETFNYSNVNIFLSDSTQDGMVLKAGASGGKCGMPLGTVIRINEGLVGRVAFSGEPLNHGVIKEGTGALEETASGIRSELAVPIRIGNETFGVLDIQSTAARAFDEIDLFTAQTLGDQLAVAVENARLYQESRDIAVLEERNRMAREIHDTLAQGFTGIILQLEAAEQSLEGDTLDAQEHLGRARTLARESLNEARRSVWALRPHELERLPLTEAINQQVEEFSRDTGIRADFKISGYNERLSTEIENALLRIFQESMMNIQKHARASEVAVDLTVDQGVVRLRVDDNGVGFDSASSAENRFGLIGMRERAKLLGGAVVIRSEKGKGTHLEVTLPIHRGTR